ncbi:MAG: type VII secretion protein EssC, partial [Synergistaceae bacterium]|nr:type VII secretion protein EssC [Synergistaceae bacterium]
VDDKLVTSENFELHDGAVIFISGFVFEFRNDSLKFTNTPGNVIVSLNLINSVAASFNLPKSYPLFYLSPRIRKNVATKEVEVLAPPATGSKPSVSWLSVLLPPGMMITVMLIIAAFTKNINTLFYTLPMSSVTIIMAVINYRSQKKKWLEIQALATKKYQEHLFEKESEIATFENQYMSVLASINPGILECISIAKNISRRLWERTPRDSDFLDIRLGTGEVFSNVNVKIPKEQLVLEENPFLKQAAKLKERHEILSGIPVSHSFLEAPITGLVGDNESVRKMAWSILINIAAHHSYEDVKIVCIYPENEKQQWEWIRWLPHVWNKEQTRRYMSCKPESRTMLRELAETLKFRQREPLDNNRDKFPQTPFYFLVLADKKLVENSGEKFLPPSSSLGFAVLYAYGDISTLPGECNAIIDCGNLENGIKSSVQMTWEDEGRKIFTPDFIKLQLGIAENFARSLAPVHIQSSGNSGQPPSKALLFDGLGVKKVEELKVLERWQKSHSESSLAVPIGIKGNGDMFYFDVHESKMGPHGVVAGTSGSGKSEMLTAWLLSLALHFSPRDLNILLIEFKGNDLSNILSVLPHVAGVVNNLQGANVIERSLISLAAENERRQKIFASLTDLATKSLPAYQEYQKNHPELNIEPLPFLVVVLDEFAEFKKQFPEQVDKFVQIARVGRSTGLYMVLSTQSPSGIVPPQIESNVKFSICLRTANTGESKELIGTTDAFFISRPGRAYVKVGDSVYEQIQTFFSKVSYNPNRNEQEASSDINLVEISGERRDPNENKKSDGTSGDKNKIKTEGQILVSHIIDVAKNNDIPEARPVWTKLLPQKLTLSSLENEYEISRAFNNDQWQEVNEDLKIVVGLLDRPELQKQEPFVLDFTNNGHQILFGAPSSGKTTFLQTAVLSAAMSYTPEQLQFLIFDFGSGSMRTFEDLPHTLMVANSKKQDKLQEAEEFLLNELDRRNNLFEAQRVSTIAAYKKVSGKNLPFIIVAIDNIMVIKNQFSDMMDSIVKIASEGGGLGIYILATSSGSSIFKLDDYIKSKHALELTDISEYRSLVGAPSKKAPEKFPGRGFTQGALEFQTALCATGETEADIVMNLRNICLAMREAWSGNSASLEEEKTRDIDISELET